MKSSRQHKSLFPVLTILDLKHSYPLVSIASAGIAVGKLTNQDFLMSGGACSAELVVVATKIQPDLLSYLDLIVAVISTEEDPSSHVSIVCRAKGIPIVNIDKATFGEIQILNGQIIQCAIDTFSRKLLFGSFLLDRTSHIKIRSKILSDLHGVLPFSITSNADTADDVKNAVACGFRKFWPRSETLLYSQDVLPVFRALLIRPTPTLAERFKELHQESIVALLRAAGATRLVFRLLDPPAHEFLPHSDDARAIQELSAQTGLTADEVKDVLISMQEDNPMMGHRGARLLLTHPSLLEAQVRALCDAWLSLEDGKKPHFVEIFVPFVITSAELMALRTRIFFVIQKMTVVPMSIVKFGTMIETPAILECANDIAPLIDFASYGTNDLAAIFYGLSRGDCYRTYLRRYIEDKLIEVDPLFEFAPHLLKRIINFSAELRAVKPIIEIDTCGEQAVGSNIWNAVKEGAFDSISIGVENLPAFLENMRIQGYVNEYYQAITQ